MATVASDAFALERFTIQNAAGPGFGFVFKREPLAPRFRIVSPSPVARREGRDGERGGNIGAEISIVRAGWRTDGDPICERRCDQGGLAFAPLRDASLRRGDAVMTPAGFVVFVGAEGARHTASDFSALEAAPIDVAKRGALQEMERASLPAARPAVTAWLAEQTARAVAEQTARAVAGQTARAVAEQTARAVAEQTARAVAGQTARAVAEQTASAVAGQTARAVAGQNASAVVAFAPALTSTAPQLVASAAADTKIRLVVWRGATDGSRAP